MAAICREDYLAMSGLVKRWSRLAKELFPTWCEDKSH